MDPQHCCREVYLHDRLEHPRIPPPHAGDQRVEQQRGSEAKQPGCSSQLLGHVQQVALDDQMLCWPHVCDAGARILLRLHRIRQLLFSSSSSCEWLHVVAAVQLLNCMGQKELLDDVSGWFDDGSDVLDVLCSARDAEAWMKEL